MESNRWKNPPESPFKKGGKYARIVHFLALITSLLNWQKYSKLNKQGGNVFIMREYQHDC